MKYTDSDYRSKSESEFSVYQKDLETTEPVILCVAKAEKMIREIGLSCLADSSDTETYRAEATASIRIEEGPEYFSDTEPDD